jgi:hypothetical protein
MSHHRPVAVVRLRPSPGAVVTTACGSGVARRIAAAQEHAVDSRDRRAAPAAPKDRELVSQNDDFEFRELLRPSAQAYEFEKRPRSNT